MTKASFVSHRDLVMAVLIAAIFILAVVYSVFSASTLSATQLGVGTSTPGAALSAVGGLLVAGGDAQILGPLKVSYVDATSTTASTFAGALTVTGADASSFSGSLGTGTTSPGAQLSVRGGFLVAGGDAQILGPLNVSFLVATSSTASSFVGSVGVGTSSPTSDLGVSGSATTTVHVKSTSATQGSCLQMETPDGRNFRMYVSNQGSLVTEAGSCR